MAINERQIFLDDEFIKERKEKLYNAICDNNFSVIKKILKEFPNIEEFLDLNEFKVNPRSERYKSEVIRKYNISEKQFRRFKVYFRVIKKLQLLYEELTYEERCDIDQLISDALLHVKSTGWYTGLKSTEIEKEERPTGDHIFSRKLIAKYYLNNKNIGFEYFINSYRNLYGLTTRICSKKNTEVKNAFNKFIQLYELEINEIPKILPLVSYFYKKCYIELEEENCKLLHSINEYIKALFLED